MPKCDPTGFQTKVMSSSGGQYYDVALLSSGWHCSCPAFQYRGGQCKHIASVKDDLCTWEGPEDDLDDGCCPKCGNSVTS